MKVTLVIPCYNEEENIDKMYAAIEEAFLGKGMDLELVYVNDGSRDNTLQKLRALLSKTDFQIKIFDDRFAVCIGKANLFHVKNGAFIESCIISVGLLFYRRNRRSIEKPFLFFKRVQALVESVNISRHSRNRAKAFGGNP